MGNLHGLVIAAATDGACSGNPGPGGWGALLRFEDGTVEELGAHVEATTNNRMELQAAISLLDHLKQYNLHPDLKIRTDSKYLIDGFEKWVRGWKKNGWRTSAGKPVLNQDLWQALDELRLPHVSFAYVKGHSGDPDNERVDQIAVSFSKGFFQALKSIDDTKIASKKVFENSDLSESAPLQIQKLYSRFELLNHFVVGGYKLTSAELAQLIDYPVIDLEKRNASWEWRDWFFEYQVNDMWRVFRKKNSLEDPMEKQDD